VKLPPQENRPQLDGVSYRKQKGQNGKLFILATGNTHSKKVPGSVGMEIKRYGENMQHNKENGLLQFLTTGILKHTR
jgi:hypothetical protein